MLATSREPLGIIGESLCSLGRRRWSSRAPGRAAVRRPRGGGRPDFDRRRAGTVAARHRDRPAARRPAAGDRAGRRPAADAAARRDRRAARPTGSGCSPAAAAPRCRGTARCAPSSNGAGSCSAPAERLLAERVSVFPAGAAPDAVAAVCGDGEIAAGETDDLLSSLVDKSLLQPLAGGRRLRMLETIREYGTERLAERGELGDAAAAARRLLRRADGRGGAAAAHPRPAALVRRAAGRTRTTSSPRCATGATSRRRARR